MAVSPPITRNELMNVSEFNRFFDQFINTGQYFHYYFY